MEAVTPHGPIPVVLAMLICDMAIVEQGTNKKTLVGIFDNLIAQEFPVIQRMAIYVKLTDAQGAYTFRLELVDIEKNSISGKAESGLIEIQERLQPSDFALPLTMTIAAPGLYEFRLYANDTYISSISFSAMTAAQSGR